MLDKFTIYGERCSGTNYLELLIKLNFRATVTWKFGWKHFFGHHQSCLDKSSDTLFVCIVRDLHPWLNSLYHNPHHLPSHLTNNVNNFLEKPVYSVSERKLLPDQHIYTGQTYKNIYELRHIKLKYLLEDLPKRVDHYIFIKYEDLISDFMGTLDKIKNKGLIVRDPSKYPLNIEKYISGGKITPYLFNNQEKENRKNQKIPRSQVITHKNLIPKYEIQLGYVDNN